MLLGGWFKRSKHAQHSIQSSLAGPLQAPRIFYERNLRRISNEVQNKPCNNIFSIRQIIEKYAEYNIDNHMVFIDFKAYNSIKRSTIWKSSRRTWNKPKTDTHDKNHIKLNYYFKYSLSYCLLN